LEKNQTLVVGPNSQYKTVQSAIDAAVAEGANNDLKRTVYIADGIYRENINLHPGISLKGSSVASTIITGSITLTPSEDGEDTYILYDLTLYQASRMLIMSSSSNDYSLIIENSRIIQTRPLVQVICLEGAGAKIYLDIKNTYMCCQNIQNMRKKLEYCNIKEFMLISTALQAQFQDCCFENCKLRFLGSNEIRFRNSQFTDVSIRSIKLYSKYSFKDCEAFRTSGFENVPFLNYPTGESLFQNCTFSDLQLHLSGDVKFFDPKLYRCMIKADTKDGESVTKVDIFDAKVFGNFCSRRSNASSLEKIDYFPIFELVDGVHLFTHNCIFNLSHENYIMGSKASSWYRVVSETSNIFRGNCKSEVKGEVSTVVENQVGL
jgi:hypothetical protein